MQLLHVCLVLVATVSYTFAIGWHLPTEIFDQHAEKDLHGHKQKFLDQMDKLWEYHSNDPDNNADSDFDISFNRNKVHTIHGKVMRTNLLQREIYAYQGFRYAKEPQKYDRFKQTELEDFPNWEGKEFYADHLGDKCPQNSMVGSVITGRRDCLFLNVYTPLHPNSQEMVNAGGLPVMFFIHGGGFVMGDASMYLPTKLLEHDVILVTIHYRLGAQGFFTLNNEKAPGNTALYDMIRALEWIQNNIEHFGGDPNTVTIFGQSTGSVAVNYLMLSPLAAGLFSGVIAESGSSLDNSALDLEPSYAANFIATFLGCYNAAVDTEIDMECMYSVTEEELVIAENNLIMTDRHNGYAGFRGAAPTIQPSNLSNPFITEHPLSILYSGNFNQVPLMTGANRDEGSYVVGIMYWNFLMSNGYDDDYEWQREHMVETLLMSAGIEDNTHMLDESLTNYYCRDIKVENLTHSYGCITDMVGALFLKAGSWQTCNIHSEVLPEQNRFYYSFEFESDDTMYVWLMGSAGHDTGVSHSDELIYIFSMPAVMDGENQALTEQRMSLMWTNFAKYGDPTPISDISWQDIGIPKWQSIKFGEPHYMKISDEWDLLDEYSDRWTISFDNLIDGSQTTPGPYPTTSMSRTKDPIHIPTHNTLLPTNCPVSQEEYDRVLEENYYLRQENTYLVSLLDDLQYERDAYLITMIVFITAFAFVTGFCIYLLVKPEQKK